MPVGGTGFYRGWLVVALAMLASTLILGSTAIGFGAFVQPVSDDLKVSRATISIGYVVLTLGMAVFAPIAGRLTTRVPIRLLMILSAILTGGALIGVGLSENLVLDAVLIAGPVAFGFAAGGNLLGFTLIARWFEKRRGRAMALGAIGQGLGGLLVLPPLAFAIQTYGWRSALMIVGAIVAVVLTIATLLVPEHPAPGEMEAAGEKVDAPAATAVAHGGDAGDQWTMGRLLSSGNFWLIGTAGAMLFAVAQVLGTSIVPFGQEKGLTLIQATTLVSAMTIISLLAKLVLATFADKIDQIWLMIGGALVLGGVMAGLTVVVGYGPLLAVSVVGGLCNGIFFPLFSMIFANYFGARAYGTALGLVTPVISIVAAALVRYANVTYDKAGSYDPAFLSMVGALGVSAVLLFVASRFRPKAVVV
ncbi:MFS transporter [Sphingomonas crocodyli]|uniref:MFS transporter n=1 Tax=Sphingomonas crocodyli TaxID=1979270 RepID=A0A437MAS4_9SPHN|nr:MFS transporter [Sphingomonas crocodyli]RVT94744.1 MFS transporter [Sphingomonas crocodyli]